MSIPVEGPVQTTTTYCQCGLGRLHGKIRVFVTDLLAEEENDNIFILADSCPYGPDSGDILVAETPGYKLCYRPED